ncbi:MAG: V-type ATP synthase subunit D [Promethearchaeota archaeon]|nr:MAG: V-type ATP synthase subunit D [Candidatus Lokiarchaeota archaeon]
MLNLKRRLDFAIKGQNFLEFRREQLIIQIKKIWKDYKIQRNDLLKSYKETLSVLIQTYEEMGKNQVNFISKLSKIQYKPRINIQTKKKMGIVISQIEYELFQEEKLPAYTFENTSHYLDDLLIDLKNLFSKFIKFSEFEDLLLKVALYFKKINRRINGLKNIITPRLESQIRQIKNILEEIERENYVRLKKTKDLIIKEE